MIFASVVAGTYLPSPWLLPSAVGMQVLFVLGEAACLVAGTGRGEELPVFGGTLLR